MGKDSEKHIHHQYSWCLDSSIYMCIVFQHLAEIQHQSCTLLNDISYLTREDKTNDL